MCETRLVCSSTTTSSFRRIWAWVLRERTQLRTAQHQHSTRAETQELFFLSSKIEELPPPLSPQPEAPEIFCSPLMSDRFRLLFAGFTVACAGLFKDNRSTLFRLCPKEVQRHDALILAWGSEESVPLNQAGDVNKANANVNANAKAGRQVGRWVGGWVYTHTFYDVFDTKPPNLYQKPKKTGQRNFRYHLSTTPVLRM